MPRVSMAAHIDPIKGDCPKLPCPFGCQETFSPEHQLEGVVVHLNTLLGKVQSQAAEVDNIPRDSIQPDILVQRVEAMEGKVTEMTEKVETQRLELARFDRQGHGAIESDFVQGAAPLPAASPVTQIPAASADAMKLMERKQNTVESLVAVINRQMEKLIVEYDGLDHQHR